MWRDWFYSSKTIWSSVLPKIVNRAICRKVRMELDQVWEIRLDLLLELVDECWTEKEEMGIAIKIERATRQKIWREFENTLRVVYQLNEEFAEGTMRSPTVGPTSIFLRCKVSHPMVLKVIGETLAKYLNCVFIDEKDKQVDAVRQCLFRAMISSQEAPRWVFKDFELGWTEIDQNNEIELEARESKICDETQREEPVQAISGLFHFVKYFFNNVSGIFKFIWRMVHTEESKYASDDVIEKDEHEHVKDSESIYCIAPTSTHSLFPTVLELLDCDSSWLKSFLVENAGIDKILVVPKFEEAISHVENISNEFTLAGVDDSGAVCHLQCGAIVQYEGASVGDVEYPASNYHGEDYKVHYWGGRDIRDRWPHFAQRLREMVSCEEEAEEQSVEAKDEEYIWDSDDDYSQEDSDALCTDESVSSDNSDLGIGHNLSENEENISTYNKHKTVPSQFSVVNRGPEGLFIVRKEAERYKEENDTTDGTDELRTSDLEVSPELSDNDGDGGNDADVIISGLSGGKDSIDKITSSNREISQDDEQQRIFGIDEDYTKYETEISRDDEQQRIFQIEDEDGIENEI